MLKITAINTLQNHGRHFPYLEGPDFFANQAPLTVEERKNLSSPLRDSSSSSSASSPKVLLRSVSTESTGSINSVDHTSQENRKIVGNERDGSFLVVYERKDVESKNKKTFFDLWYPNLTNVLTPVFKSSSTNIVGASLSQFDRDSSESRPLWAAFTVVRNLPQPPEEMKKKNLGPIVYESHIVELIYPEDRFSTYASTTGRHFINHNKKEEGKRELQRVQFLSSSSKKSTWYLYLREGREDSAAEIYSVNNIQKTEPQYRGLIADKFLWCEFDSNKEQLFVLTNRNSKDMSTDTIFLRCFSFSDKSDKGYSFHSILFEKDEKEIAVEFDISLPIPLPAAPKMYLNSWFDFTYRKLSAYFHCVTLRSGTVCLCYQHPITHLFIEISIYLVQNKTKLSFTIPLSNTSDTKLDSNTLRVFFGSLGNMLLIYLPGHYIHFVDCGHDSSVIPGASFSGEVLAPYAPFQPESFPSLVPYDLNIIMSSAAPDLKGHCFIDITSGTAYEYSFHRETIWKIYDMNFSDKDLAIQLLHIAMAHLQDEELVGKIISHVCTNGPKKASAQFFQEFLLGSSYQEILSIIKSKSEHPLEKFFPLTTLEPVNINQRLDLSGSPNNQNSKKTIKIKNVTYTPLLTNTKSPNSRDERLALGDSPLFKKISSPLRDNLSPSKSSPPGVKRFFRDLLGLDDNQTKIEEAEDVREVESFKEMIKEGMLTLIGNSYSKEKPFITTLSHTYSDILMNQSTKLLKFLTASRTRNSSTTFQLLENYYFGLEEFNIPFPRGFLNIFSDYGFNCLQRSVFLQYLEQGLFSLDEQLVLKIVKSLTGSPEDEAFKYHLISRLPHQFEDYSEHTAPLSRPDPCLNALRQTSRDSPHLSQYLVTAFGELTHAASEDDIYNQLSNSPFIPVHEFFNRVRLKYPQDWELVKGSTRQQLSRSFKFNFDIGNTSQKPYEQRISHSSASQSQEEDFF